MDILTTKSDKVVQRKAAAKDRFIKVYDNFVGSTGKTNREIAIELGIPLGTLNDTINRDTKTLSADVVAAFCAEYRVTDLNYIYLDEQDEPQEDNVSYTLCRHSVDCHPLRDESFLGTFYGYCRNTQYLDVIDSFVLTINVTTKNKSQAKLVLNTHNQKREVVTKTLYGTPMHLEPDMIYIVFQSEWGDDMFIMSYNWFKINSGKKLYCRYGGVITPCRSTVRFPQEQIFLMLDKPILEEKMHYLNGFFTMAEDRIIVPAKAYEGDLMQNNEKVKEFFDKCSDLQYKKEEYYCFSEKVLLALGEANEVDYDTTAATIMTLKEKSINPRVVSFPNNKTYSKFFSSLTKENDDYITE